jgi:hypothetical protein
MIIVLGDGAFKTFGFACYAYPAHQPPGLVLRVLERINSLELRSRGLLL